MVEVRKAVKLSLVQPTSSKAVLFDAVAKKYIEAINLCKTAIEFWDGFSDAPLTRRNLHNIAYKGLRRGLPSQLAVDAISDAWANREHPCARIRTMAISFNVSRSGSIAETERHNPIVLCKLNGKRIVIPIEMDGAWRRFNEHMASGWSYTQFRIERNGTMAMRVILKKKVPVKAAKGTIGIDVGSKCLAATSEIGEDGRKVQQLYFGQDVAVVQQRTLARRSKLQSNADTGSRKAMRSLDHLRGYEENFTKTRCYQTAHQIVDMAVKNGRSISIEDLNHLNDSRLNRASNKIVKRLPYHEFRAALEAVAGQSGIKVVVVPAENTSRTCSRCGHIAKESRKRSVFRCVKCGFVLNADRNASVNIARRGQLLERQKALDIVTDSIVGCQTSSDGGRVNGPARNHDGLLSSCSQHAQPPEFKPPILMGGS
jgi:IS605 OrfB family transposase